MSPPSMNPSSPTPQRTESEIPAKDNWPIGHRNSQYFRMLTGHYSTMQNSPILRRPMDGLFGFYPRPNGTPVPHWRLYPAVTVGLGSRKDFQSMSASQPCTAPEPLATTPISSQLWNPGPLPFVIGHSSSQRLGEGAPNLMDIQCENEDFDLFLEKRNEFPEACSPSGLDTPNSQVFSATVGPLLLGENPTGSVVQE